MSPAVPCLAASPVHLSLEWKGRIEFVFFFCFVLFLYLSFKREHSSGCLYREETPEWTNCSQDNTEIPIPSHKSARGRSRHRKASRKSRHMVRAHSAPLSLVMAHSSRSYPNNNISQHTKVKCIRWPYRRMISSTGRPVGFAQIRHYQGNSCVNPALRL